MPSILKSARVLVLCGASALAGVTGVEFLQRAPAAQAEQRNEAARQPSVEELSAVFRQVRHRADVSERRAERQDEITRLHAATAAPSRRLEVVGL
ncbi:MAG TPA: hypothetical protein VHP11_12880, partial [Tepidisphaeraceae bacterium]|nr:hypothetical protein [Tepidisphaeraceae bacterium]